MKLTTIASHPLQFVAKRLGLKVRAKLLILDLDSSGKTTLLYRIKLSFDQQQAQEAHSLREIHTITTIGFNVESFQFNHVGFEAWEVGGSQPLLWRYYYKQTNFVIFVVDSTDRERLKRAIAALNRVFQDGAVFLKDAPLLVFANKQDREGCLTLDEIADALINGPRCGDSGGDDIQMVMLKRSWPLLPLVTMTAQGVNEGLAWLAAQYER